MNFIIIYSTNYRFKAIYLGYVCRQILLTHLGIIKETDRDSYNMKRIMLAGNLLLELYRELWGKYMRNIQRTLDDEFKIILEGGGKLDVSEIINDLNKELPSLDNFILPGGHKDSSKAQIIRAVCRRSERSLVMASETELINKNCIIYINRLSDFLFVLARKINIDSLNLFENEVHFVTMRPNISS